MHRGVLNRTMVQYLAGLSLLKAPSSPTLPPAGEGSHRSSPYGRGRSEAEGALSAEALAVLDAGQTLWQALLKQMRLTAADRTTWLCNQRKGIEKAC